MKGRYEAMSIEKKYTEEEMKAIVAEEIRKMNPGMNRELSADELESVSGGKYVVPKTHEEIDRLWDSVEAVRKAHGQDVVYFYAYELNLTATTTATKFAEYGTGHYRQMMHDILDGKIQLEGLDAYTSR